MWLKDPQDVAWFEFDWGGGGDPTKSFLAPGETITSHTTTVDTNITKVTDAATTTTVSIKTSGGTGTKALLTCQIVTNQGNTYNDQQYVYFVTRQTN